MGCNCEVVPLLARWLRLWHAAKVICSLHIALCMLRGARKCRQKRQAASWTLPPNSRPHRALRYAWPVPKQHNDEHHRNLHAGQQDVMLQQLLQLVAGILAACSGSCTPHAACFVQNIP
jgi:hypothetical protein